MNYDVPFPPGTKVHVKTYPGHNPDDKKMDLYAEGWPAVVAPAAGVVVKNFGCNPGAGFQLYHGDGKHTVYCHVQQAPAIGTRFAQGQVMGRVGEFPGMAKHLHWEQLDSGSEVADTADMVHPTIQGKTYVLVSGEPGLTFIAAAPGAQPSPTQPTLEDDMPYLLSSTGSRNRFWLIGGTGGFDEITAAEYDGYKRLGVPARAAVPEQLVAQWRASLRTRLKAPPSAVADVDEAALAKALAPLLSKGATPAEVAKAVVAEIAS